MSQFKVEKLDLTSLIIYVQCSKLAVVGWPATSEFFVWPVEISKPQVRLACRIFFIKN